MSEPAAQPSSAATPAQSNPPAAREAVSRRAVSDADYEKMTLGERRVHTARANGAAWAQGDGDEGASTQPDAPTDSGQKFRFGKLDLSEKEMDDLRSFKAAEDSRKLTLPQKPEDYKLELTKDFKAPAGIEFVPDENDPLLPHARAFAQKHGLSQDAFSELLDLHAAGQVADLQAMKEAKAAEVQKLGPAGTARKTAIDNWLKAQLGDELGKHVSEFTFTARQVEAFEKIMANFRTQGASGFSPQHRDSHDHSKLTDEQYQRLSYAEKIEYAKQFSQPAR